LPTGDEPANATVPGLDGQPYPDADSELFPRHPSCTAAETSPKEDTMARRHVSADDSAIVMIDYAVGFANLFRSHTVAENSNAAVAVAKIAQIYGVPLVVTSGPDEAPGGPLYPALKGTLGDHPVVIRLGAFDGFDEPQFEEAIEATGRRRLVMAGLMTEGCVLQTALTALDRGYEVFVVVDASAGETLETHQVAVQRMVQAGVIPTTWLSITSEYQRTWQNESTKEQFAALINGHTMPFAMQGVYAASIAHFASGVTV
jgi:nicotinamidase-related amidase